MERFTELILPTALLLVSLLYLLWKGGFLFQEKEITLIVIGRDYEIPDMFDKRVYVRADNPDILARGDVVVITKRELTPKERDVLASYLLRGGKVVFVVDGGMYSDGEFRGYWLMEKWAPVVPLEVMEVEGRVRDFVNNFVTDYRGVLLVAEDYKGELLGEINVGENVYPVAVVGIQTAFIGAEPYKVPQLFRVVIEELT